MPELLKVNNERGSFKTDNIFIKFLILKRSMTQTYHSLTINDIIDTSQNKNLMSNTPLYISIHL